jgi:hypothetical protein
MLRCTIVLLVALTLAGCRTGFPSLSVGPESAPTVLSDAKTAAPAASSQLQQEQAGLADARAEAERETSGAPVIAPRKLLAALPLAYAETMPEGVIGRAIESAQTSNRSLIIVGVGAGAERAVAALAAAMEARGARVRQEVSNDEANAPSRVDLYLGT